MAEQKKLLRALAGETQDVPPVWMMRQAGRYLPEYRATRAEAGDFLSLCYNPELAAEVTLQPIRRYGFDAAILFADILLLPQALGAKVWFVTGEGPRLSTITNQSDFNALGGVEAIHETLSPIYETLKILKSELPKETTLIGFAGAPWTVATYMIAGRGTPDQGPAHALKDTDRATFQQLIDLITDGTIEYLAKQIEAGAEVVKIFDSWAGSLKGQDFHDFALLPAKKIIQALNARYPNVPIIAFPREAGPAYEGFAKAVGAQCLAIDTKVDLEWAAKVLQPDSCVQGNLDPKLMVEGGDKLISETKRIKEALGNGPHIFNLGHGITPDADPANVDVMLKALRG
ncbi:MULTISPECIES: uroporphyrinogen decarboxylase [Halocynthiibacter]|uniref:Uroporphyrinogen decarboxylase n=1 Tax=Halocynthiibacter halioticoli TaxID=2986804 RepID=A0AAE3IX62_9RHOB|nr:MULTISPECIES: uroporphyrinogen decarboxylase [Halocynthiibacter]MCV6823354.1 uroporphyrinogen decarboxylase [Halocynthiibacter halioticoli]MCW4056355.1 uroporphyrinogen decarboxylase [Halocynthiibacter sp. SDUM655004]